MYKYLGYVHLHTSLLPRIFAEHNTYIALKMCDIKSVIVLLCKYLNLSIDSSFKTEYFRLAKYNKGDKDVIQALWSILHTLSCYGATDKKIHIDFGRYDDVYATKLYFAFLQYPTTDFYAISKKNISCSRELLLAFGWLIATKKVLNIVMREKLTMSVLAHDYSCAEASPVSTSIERQEKIKIHGSPVDLKSQMNNIAHTCGRIGHNVKEIAELLQEKVKLTTKIHGATLNISGLPHLSVFQVAIIKQFSIHKRQDFTKKDEESLEELHSLATILETHNQWTKVEHVFYNWMVTVIEEAKSNKDSSIAEDRCKELSDFLSLLRHVTKKKLHSLKTNETMQSRETSLYEDSCTSRFFRTSQEDTDTELWSSKTVEQLKTIEGDVRIKMTQLTSELRKMLKSIANCVEI